MIGEPRLDIGNIKKSEEQKLTILEKVNKSLADLGSTAKWKRAPEFLEEYKPLRGKTLVMIDDVKKLLEHFAPNLMVATDGNASFVEYTDQDPDKLVKQIMQHNPDIVIIDYHLSDYLKGSSVIESLKEKNFSGKVIGFSSDNDTVKAFMNAGAIGTVEKDASQPEKSVTEMANLISKE